MTNNQKSSKIFSFLKKLILTSTLGVAILALGIFLGILQTKNKIITGVESLFQKPELVVDNNDLVLTQIRGLSELTTSVFVMQTVVPTSANRKLGELIVAQTKLLYIAQGEVRAGIDLSKIKPDDIQLENNTIQVQLPPAEILDSKIDVNHSRVYDYDRGWLNLGPDVAPELQTLAQRETLGRIVSNACRVGVLDEANDKAKVAIGQLLMTAGYETIEIKTSKPNFRSCTYLGNR